MNIDSRIDAGFAKDPTIKNWSVCDANTFLADTIMESYESLYVKIHETTNVLLAKGASSESLTMIVPPYMTERLVHNSVNKWKVYQDDEMPKDQIEIGSDIGKAVLVVLNFPEKVGEC